MKKSRIILVVLLLIALGAAVVYQFSKGESTIKGSQSDFSIKDTNAITRIFLADMEGHEVLLEKNNAVWMVNKKYIARESLVRILLETLYKMRVKAPVAKPAYDKVIRDLAATGIKVEVYQGGAKPVKTYYVGNPNQSHTGSYMIIEGSSIPYLVHIEGFYGYLSPRFSVNENDWRSRIVFDTPPKSIEYIKVEHPANPESGFVIDRTENGGFQLKNSFEIPVTGWDTVQLYDYINLYSKVNFESMEETKTKAFIDSVKLSQPLNIYTVKSVTGETSVIKTYIKPISAKKDLDGSPLEHDLDRMYGLINEREFVVIQYFTFDPLNQKLSYFIGE